MTNSTKSHAMQQQSPAWSGELQALMEAYHQAGGDPASFQAPEVATMAVRGDQVLVSHSITGVHLPSQPIENGRRGSVWVAEATHGKHPVPLRCGV